jgi:multidrug efflux pump subunit AcrB
VIRFAIRRPLATVTVFAGLAALGIPSARRMPIELLPDVDHPRLEVSVGWPGASPEQVEALVSSPVEAAAQEVRGVRSVGSTSWPDRSAVTVEFEPATDMDFARLDLAERLSALSVDLPAGTLAPEIEPWVPGEFADATQPLLAYTVAGPGTLGALREYAQEELLPELAAVQGVGGVEVSGGSGRLVRVRLDPDRMAAFGIGPVDVRRSLASGLNVVEAGGSFRMRNLAFTLVVDDRAEGIADVEALVVEAGGSEKPAVRLGQIGEIALTYAEPRERHRLNGDPAVALYLHRLPGTNAVGVVDRVRERLERLETQLPIGYRVIEDYDGSEQIREQLAELRDRGLLSTACVLLVLLVAFRRWSPALLVLGTIAASVLVTLDLMALAGLSLNILTLSGLAMGVGIIDDNAIVVLESIEARRIGVAGASHEEEESTARAARKVVAPLIAASLTNLIVFLPFLYLQGELRAYYVPFAITVGLALLTGLVAAFSLVPALAAGVRPPPFPAGGSRRRSLWHGPRLRPRDPYGGAIVGAVRHRRVTVGSAFLLLAGSLWLFWEEVPRGRTWAGLGDQTFLNVQIRMPPGADLEQTDEIVRRIEIELARIPEVDRYDTRVGPGHASIQLTFPDSLAATRVPPAVREELVSHSRTLGGAVVRVYGFGPGFQGVEGGPPSYGLELKGYDYRELDRMIEELAERLRSFPRIRDVDPNAAGHWFDRERATELVLAPDRNRLSAYGLAAQDLLGMVAAHTRGDLTRETATVAGKEADVSLEIDRARETDVEAFLDLAPSVGAGAALRVRDVASVHERTTLGRIVREDQQYQRIVSWEFRGPRKLGDGVRDAVVEATLLPAGYGLEAKRTFWEYEKGEKGQLALVVALALALVYMVTAALFESLKAPLVVLATVPLALIGVFLLYVLTGEAFTREAWIGVVMMAGIVVNNAILVVDRVGALRQGADGPAMPLEEAAVRGTLERVRPILMTTGTTVLGLLPLVLFARPGSATLWTPIALAMIGGLLASTLLVLVTIPALYVMMKPRSGPRRATARR